MPRFALAFALAALLSSTVGCASETLDVEPDAPFAGGGQPAQPAGPAYPQAPYGLGVGSVVPDLRFVGFAHAPAHEKGASVEMDLSDYYNPTGHDVYPADSPHGAGQPKPTMLLLDLAHVWCPPSNQIAVELSARYAADRKQGVEYLDVLEDGPQPGTPATLDDLFDWTTRVDMPYPAVVDPGSIAWGFDPTDFLPLLVEVDVTSMRVVATHVGNFSPTEWSVFEADVAASRK